MSSIHVLISHGNWHDEVNIEVVDHIDNETHHHNQACVLKVSDLDIHSSKFYAPSNFRIL